MGLKEIISALLTSFTLSSLASADDRYLEYCFKTSLLKVPLVTGNFYYEDNDKEIKGEIIPTGGIIQELSKLFKHRRYHTIIYNDSTVYFEKEDSTKIIKKVFNINSPYFDALTCIKKLLDCAKRDSLEYHPLIKEGSLNLFVENKVLCAKLKYLEDLIIKYEGKKIKVKKLSIYGCPDDQTHIDLFIYNDQVIKVQGKFDNFFGIRLNAELKK